MTSDPPPPPPPPFADRDRLTNGHKQTKREDPLTGSKISPEDHNFAQSPRSKKRDTDGRIGVVTQYHLVGDRSEGAGEEEGAPFSVIGQGAARPGATGPARVHEKGDVVQIRSRFDDLDLISRSQVYQKQRLKFEVFRFFCS